jgi:phenylpropionate dioxygenase-like ring-hydroxylating dioxygenase large terminal subunit
MRPAARFGTAEGDGFVWIWAEPDTTPTRPVFKVPDFAGHQTVFPCDLDCGLTAALENSLDVPHTAFLHRGAFRGGEPAQIVAVRSEVPGGVEVCYHGEPVRFGPLHLAGRTFDHWDRFLLPSVAQIEYRVEGWLHIVNTIVHLPMAPDRTRAWFVVRYRSRLPASIMSTVVQLRGRQILRQDARMLARQQDNIRRFGGEQYASTELDLMGNAIRRLLRGEGVTPRSVSFSI